MGECGMMELRNAVTRPKREAMAHAKPRKVLQIGRRRAASGEEESAGWWQQRSRRAIGAPLDAKICSSSDELAFGTR